MNRNNSEALRLDAESDQYHYDYFSGAEGEEYFRSNRNQSQQSISQGNGKQVYPLFEHQSTKLNVQIQHDRHQKKLKEIKDRGLKLPLIQPVTSNPFIPNTTQISRAQQYQIEMQNQKFLKKLIQIQFGQNSMMSQLQQNDMPYIQVNRSANRIASEQVKNLIVQKQNYQRAKRISNLKSNLFTSIGVQVKKDQSQQTLQQRTIQQNQESYTNDNFNSSTLENNYRSKQENGTFA